MIILEATQNAQWFEQFMATPIADFIVTILGVLTTLLICLGRLKKATGEFKTSFNLSNEHNAELSKKIGKLDDTKLELERSREELKNAKNELQSTKDDIKALKQALCLIAQNSCEVVGSGAAKQVVDILKDGDANESKHC